MELLKDEEIVQALQKAGCLNITVTAIPLGQVIAKAQLDADLKNQQEKLQEIVERIPLSAGLCYLGGCSDEAYECEQKFASHKCSWWNQYKQQIFGS